MGQLIAALAASGNPVKQCITLKLRLLILIS